MPETPISFLSLFVWLGEMFMFTVEGDLPLADSFAIKVSGYWQDDDGYVKNVTTGERLNDDDGWGVRLGLKGELAPWARWRASYAHVVSEGENTLNFTCNPANPTDCKGRFSTTGLSENPQSATPFAPLVIQGRKAGYGNGQKAETDIITSNLAFDIADKTTLSLITGYVSIASFLSSRALIAVVMAAATASAMLREAST